MHWYLRYNSICVILSQKKKTAWYCKGWLAGLLWPSICLTFPGCHWGTEISGTVTKCSCLSWGTWVMWTKWLTVCRFPMVERQSHEGQNNGHPHHRVRAALDVSALYVRPGVKISPLTAVWGCEQFSLKLCVVLCFGRTWCLAKVTCWWNCRK